MICSAITRTLSARKSDKSKEVGLRKFYAGENNKFEQLLTFFWLLNLYLFAYVNKV